MSTRLNRRKFIKKTGAGVAGLSALRMTAAAPTRVHPKRGAIPPHRSVYVPGVHAYTDQISVAAGQTIAFHVSSSVPYRLSICRLGLKVDDPVGDDVLHEFPEAQPEIQSIHPGSYVHIERALRGQLRAFFWSDRALVHG